MRLRFRVRISIEEHIQGEWVPVSAKEVRGYGEKVGVAVRRALDDLRRKHGVTNDPG